MQEAISLFKELEKIEAIYQQENIELEQAQEIKNILLEENINKIIINIIENNFASMKPCLLSSLKEKALQYIEINLAVVIKDSEVKRSRYIGSIAGIMFGAAGIASGYALGRWLDKGKYQLYANEEITKRISDLYTGLNTKNLIQDLSSEQLFRAFVIFLFAIKIENILFELKSDFNKRTEGGDLVQDGIGISKLASEEGILNSLDLLINSAKQELANRESIGKKFSIYCADAVNYAASYCPLYRNSASLNLPTSQNSLTALQVEQQKQLEDRKADRYMLRK